MKHIISSLFCLIYASTFAQIELNLKDVNNIDINFGYVKVFYNGNIIFGKSYSKAQNILNLDNDYKKISIEVVSNGYFSQTKTLEDYLQGNKYKLEFILEKNNTFFNDTIIVSSAQQAILEKNDTTTFKIKRFTDGTERKLEDILNKLPGITVNKKTGQIQFKGKPIETILLEGENLVGNKYTLASKNIAAQLVDEIQAFENYNENYVLESIDASEKTVLNIKLKKSKFKLSGAVEMGNGYNAKNKIKLDNSINLFGLQNKFKTLSTISFNDIGLNKSDVNGIENGVSIDDKKLEPFRSLKHINEPSLAIFSDISRVNFNNEFFTNTNSNYTLGSKLLAKLNTYFTIDRISNNQTQTNEFVFNSDTINTKDNNQITNKPRYARVDLNLRNSINKKELLEIDVIAQGNNLNSKQSINSNFLSNYKTIINNKSKLLKQEITYSKRVNKIIALQIIGNNSISSNNELLNTNPAVNFNNITNVDSQKVFNKKHNTTLQLNVIGSKQKVKYTISIIGTKLFNQFNSIVGLDVPALISNNYKNIVDYNSTSIALTKKFNLKLNKTTIKAKSNIIYFDQKLKDKINFTNEAQKQILIEPSLSIVQKISNKASITLTATKTAKPVVEKYMFYKNVVLSNRLVSSNKPSVLPITNRNLGLNYNYYNTFNFFNVNCGFQFQTTNGDYFPYYLISDSTFITFYEYRLIKNRNKQFYLNIGKYIPSLLANIKCFVNFSNSNYINFISSTDIRNNISNNLNAELIYRSAFSGKINICYEFVFNFLNIRTKNNNSLINIGTENKFSFIFKASKLITIDGDFNFFMANNKSKIGNNFFGDLNCSFKPRKNRHFELRGIIRNIFNNTQINNIQNNDFSKSTYRANLLPRFYMLYFGYSL